MIEGHASAGEGFGLDDSDDMMNLSVSVDGEEDDFGDTDGLLSGNVGDDPENANGSGDGAPAKQQFGLCGWTTVAFYRSYFDVDTDDVKERLKRALMPWKRDFFELLGSKTDLYGPVWICATLVFLIGVTSNLSSWLAHPADAEPWHYDFKLLTFAATLVTSCVLLMPFAAWFAMRYIGASGAIGFLNLVCVYGYSITAFVPASILCGIFPSRVWNWSVVSIAFGLSATFLFSNIWTAVRRASNIEHQTPEGRKRLAILILGLFGIHAVFALLLKVYFFGTYAVAAEASSTDAPIAPDNGNALNESPVSADADNNSTGTVGDGQ